MTDLSPILTYWAESKTYLFVGKLNVACGTGVLPDLLGEEASYWCEDVEVIGAADFVKVKLRVGRCSPHRSKATDVTAGTLEDKHRGVHRM